MDRKSSVEIWKDIEGYEGLYQVSNLGRVKSLGNNKTRKEKILKGIKERGDYLKVILCKEGNRKHFKVHRLVASAFIPNYNNLPQVNHKDEDKNNNRVDNLEWCDCKYNINYGSHNKRMIKANSIPIIQFSKTGEFIHKWDSAREAEKELGIDKGNICSCLKGRYKTAGNYKWEYADDYERIPFNVFNLTIYRKKVA